MGSGALGWFVVALPVFEFLAPALRELDGGNFNAKLTIYLVDSHNFLQY